MERHTPRAELSLGTAAGSLSDGSVTRMAVATLIAVFSFAAFLPALSNEFVTWDDYENLVGNPRCRGLAWSQLHWMFTTFHMGPYHPLSWLSYAFDYLIWGKNG